MTKNWPVWKDQAKTSRSAGTLEVGLDAYRRTRCKVLKLLRI
jgi:hypothetical protein